MCVKGKTCIINDFSGKSSVINGSNTDNLAPADEGSAFI